MKSLKKYLLLFFLFSFSFIPSWGQWQLDVSHPVQTFDPTQWRGTPQDFEIKNGALRLKRPSGDKGLFQSSLFTTIPFADEMQWIGTVEILYTPSVSNNMYVLLYCYAQDGQSSYDYVALSIGKNSLINLVTVSVSPHEKIKGKYILRDEQVLVSPRDVPITFSGIIKYHITYARGKGWKLWLHNKENEDHFHYIGASSFDRPMRSNRSGIGFIINYTKTRAELLSIKELKVDTFIKEPPTYTPGGDNSPKPESRIYPILNEVMANPSKDGAEYVELYNPSDQSISLEGIALGLIKEDEIIKAIDLSGLTHMEPHQYLVVTASKEGVLHASPQANSSSIINIVPFLRLPNKAFTLGLVDVENKELIELMHYDSELFPQGSKNKRGIAYERIDARKASDDLKNWALALKSSGYATPTRRNSVSDKSHTPDMDKEEPSSSKRQLSPLEIAHRIVDFTSRSPQFKCSTFLYDISGICLGKMDGDETLTWCKSILNSLGFGFKERYGLYLGRYIVSVNISGVDSDVKNYYFYLCIQ